MSSGLLDIGKLPPYSILTFTGPTHKFPAPSTVYHLPAGNWMVWDTPCVIYPMRYSSPVSVSVNTTSVSQSPLTFTVWNKGCICSFFFSSLPERVKVCALWKAVQERMLPSRRRAVNRSHHFFFIKTPPFYCAAFIIQNLSAGEKYGAKFL